VAVIRHKSYRHLLRMVSQVGLVAVLLLTSLVAFIPTAAADSVTWRGEYYGNSWLGGDPVLVRDDAAVSFNWGNGSPAASIPADNFSVRWTRTANFPTSGTYVFSATGDDGVRVWVDGAIIIDKWFPQSATAYTAPVYLTAGSHTVRVEYFEAQGVASIVVNWGTGTSAAAEVIVDDRDAGFVRGGPNNWYSNNVGYRGHLFWTWNSNTQLRNWAKWFPSLPAAGNWEVYVYIAGSYFGSKSAPYTIYHNGARDYRTLNQNNYSNQWISLGAFYFSGGGGEYVYLGDNTGEKYGTRYLGFDAVKFVKRDGTIPPPPPPPPSGCAIAPVLGFGRVWNTYGNVRAKLGCAIQTEQSIWAAEEVFQGGYMFWRGDSYYIFTLYNNGTFQGFNDTWTTAEPEWDSSIVAPPGYYQPKRGFGKVWRNNSWVRATMGWGTTEERGFTGSVQQFERGMMFWSNVRGIYVLYNDGSWERYN
jgi:hypothetical protein